VTEDWQRILYTVNIVVLFEMWLEALGCFICSYQFSGPCFNHSSGLSSWCEYFWHSAGWKQHNPSKV